MADILKIICPLLSGSGNSPVKSCPVDAPACSSFEQALEYPDKSNRELVVDSNVNVSENVVPELITIFDTYTAHLFNNTILFTIYD